MKRSLQILSLSLVLLTGVIAVNRWDLPVMVWLAFLFGTIALVSGIACLFTVAG